ncbi:MAG: hypothetical protein ACUVWR_07315 [Anaerolineae bacterium]
MTGPKRVTGRQLAANCANAQRSTGPRTPEGRARRCWNALKHGALTTLECLQRQRLGDLVPV